MNKKLLAVVLPLVVCLIIFVAPILAATPPVYYNNYNGSDDAKATQALWVPVWHYWSDSVTSQMLNDLGGSGAFISEIGVNWWNRSEICGSTAVAYYPQGGASINAHTYYNSSSHAYASLSCSGHYAYESARHRFNKVGGPLWTPDTELSLTLPQ